MPPDEFAKSYVFESRGLRLQTAALLRACGAKCRGGQDFRLLGKGLWNACGAENWKIGACGRQEKYACFLRM